MRRSQLAHCQQCRVFEYNQEACVVAVVLVRAQAPLFFLNEDLLAVRGKRVVYDVIDPSVVGSRAFFEYESLKFDTVVLFRTAHNILHAKHVTYT